MSEKYEVKTVGDGLLICAINSETQTLVGFGAGESMYNLCAKLNRLAALEAACREIVERAPNQEPGREYGIDGLCENDLGWAKWDIAQKLKAVLEEV